MLSVALNHPIRTLECTKSAPKQALRVRKIPAICEAEFLVNPAERLGAVKFIDKMDLANELVPTLLQFSPSRKPC